MAAPKGSQGDDGSPGPKGVKGDPEPIGPQEPPENAGKDGLFRLEEPKGTSGPP